MGAGAEELEGGRGGALLVEGVVVEDVGGAEHDRVAVPGGRRDAHQGGQTLVGVSLVVAGDCHGVADGAGVGGARAPARRRGAGGGERGVEAGGGVRDDAGSQPFHGPAAGGGEGGAAVGVGGRGVQLALLAVRQEVGHGYQERRVGTGRCACFVEGGDDSSVDASGGEEFGDGAAAVGVGGARVEAAVAFGGADRRDRHGRDEKKHKGEHDASRAGPHLAGGGRGGGGRERGRGGHSAAPWRALWAALWLLALAASTGLVRSRSRSSSAMRWYDCSVAARPPCETLWEAGAGERGRSV